MDEQDDTPEHIVDAMQRALLARDAPGQGRAGSTHEADPQLARSSPAGPTSRSVPHDGIV